MSESASGDASGSCTDSDKEFSCPECPKEYTTPQGLRYHLKGKGCSGFECPTCGNSSFYSQHGMEVHHARTHSTSLNKSIEPCSYCDEPVKRWDSYLQKVENVFCKETDCEAKYKSEQLSGELSPSWKGGRVNVECDICGKGYTVAQYQLDNYNHRFCSSNCRGKWMKEAYKGENGPNWKGGWDYHYGHNWNKQRKKALQRDGHTCQYCGVDESEIRRSLDVHHIKPLREFKNDELDKTFARGNALTNLVSACPECHARWEGIPLKPSNV